jgi:hypothetical protein
VDINAQPGTPTPTTTLSMLATTTSLQADFLEFLTSYSENQDAALSQRALSCSFITNESFKLYYVGIEDKYGD